MICEIDISEKKKEIYTKGLFIHGYMVLLLLIYKYELSENYEECKVIYDVILEHNFIFNLNLPTRVNSNIMDEFLDNVSRKTSMSEHTIIFNLGSNMTQIEQMIINLK